MAQYRSNLTRIGFEDKGFENYSECQKDKWVFVDEYFSPCIRMCGCGYKKVRYEVLTIGEVTMEYVTLFPDSNSEDGGISAEVTGDSCWAIMEDVLKAI